MFLCKYLPSCCLFFSHGFSNLGKEFEEGWIWLGVGLVEEGHEAVEHLDVQLRRVFVVLDQAHQPTFNHAKVRFKP